MVERRHGKKDYVLGGSAKTKVFFFEVLKRVETFESN
jgi:hypothetical protein